MVQLTILEIINNLEVEILTNEETLLRNIKAEMIGRLGIELMGLTDYADKDRIFLVGTKEMSYLNSLDSNNRTKILEKIFQLSPPGIVFSVSINIDDEIIKLGNKYNVAIIKSKYRTTPTNSMLYSYLHEKLTPRTTLHGVLLDIYGMGTLIIGKSGIGKSETALELIKRGHILVSDDRVDCYEVATGNIIGYAPKVLERYLEIRGIGIVDVVQMFGAGAYRESKKIRIIVELENWNSEKVYDRLGLDEKTQRIFTTEIVKKVIPVLPGRNVSALVESAVMNQKLKYLGYDAAKELTSKVAELTRRKREVE